MNKLFFKNVSWMIILNMIELIISFLTGILSARFLGPTDYGVIYYTLSYVSFFSSFMSLGLNDIVTKELVNNPDSNQILGTSLTLRLISGLINTILIAFLMLYITKGNLLLIMIAMLQSIGLTFQFLSITISLWYQSNLNAKIPAFISMGCLIIASIYKVLIIYFQCSVLMFSLTSIIQYLLMTIILFNTYSKRNEGNLKFSFKLGISMLKQSGPLIIAGTLMTAYEQLDKILLGSMQNEAAVGIYSVACNLCVTWAFLINSIIKTGVPIVFSHKKDGEKVFSTYWTKLYSLVIFSCFVIAVGLIFCSKFIINILYGAQYLDAITPFKILVVAKCFSFLGIMRDVWLVFEQKQKYSIYFSVVGILINLMLNIWLIPVIGLNGAAFSALITQIMTCCIVPCFFNETRLNTVYMVKSLNLLKSFTYEDISNIVCKIQEKMRI